MVPEDKPLLLTEINKLTHLVHQLPESLRMEIQSRLKARGQMKTHLSSIASLLFVVLGCIQALLGAVAPDFTIAANSTALQLTAGGTATTEISSSSTNGFFGSVQLACENLPPAMSCNFTPPALELEGTAVVTSQLTISPTQQQASVLPFGQGLVVLAMIPILGAMSFWRGPGAISKAALPLLLAGVMLFSGCQAVAPPAPKTYTIAATATASDGTSHSVRIAVTVPRGSATN